MTTTEHFPDSEDDDFDVDAELRQLGMTMAEVDAAIADLESDFAISLSELWAVPEDLSDRVSRKAWRKIQDRQGLAAFGDLFGLGWQTTRAVIDPVEDDDA